MANRESFDIDGLMVFKNDLTSKDQDGNVVASVKIPNVYKKNSKEPISSEQIENVLEEPTEVAAAALNELDHRVNAIEDIVRGGDYIEVQKLKVTREIDIPEGSIPSAQIQSDWEQDDNTKPDFVKNKPAIPTVNDATLTIQQNDTTVGTFSANAASDQIINIDVPVNAADVNALPDSTKYAASLSLNVNHTTFVVTAQLKDQDGNSLGSAATIDLPLESVVVSGSYDASTKKVVLTLQSGGTVEFSVADLVAGLQSEITAQNPLSADLITDGTTNKVYTAAEQTKLAGIASGAEVNVQSDWNQTNTSADDYIKNKPNIPSKTSDLTNDSGFITADDLPQDVLLCTMTLDVETGLYSCDKTVEEIEQAYESGKLVLCKYNGGYYYATVIYALEHVVWFWSADNIKLKSFHNVISGNNYDTWVHYVENRNQEEITEVAAAALNELDHRVNAIEDIVRGGDYIEVQKLKVTREIDIPEGSIPSAQIQSDWAQTDDTAKDYIKNKPNIPDAQIQSDWNQSNSEAKDYIKNKPNIPAAQVNADWNANSGVAQILNKPTIPAAQVQADWDETDDSKPEYIKNKPTIPTVNNATLTVQRNDTTVGTFTANASTDQIINIDVPVSASDVNALPYSTKYGASVSINIDSTTYVMSAQLKDQDGSNIGNASTVDLPLESMVVNGYYNSSTKKVVLTLQSGSTIEFSVADLVAGLQSEITAQNPLSADLISDGTTNKVFTAAFKTKIENIEAGAEVNVQADWVVTDNTSDAYIKNKPTIPANTSDLANDSGFITEADLEEPTEVAAAALNNLDQRIEAVEDAITGNGDIEVKNLVVTSHVVLPEGAIPDSQIQSDWEQTDADAKDYIKNKPTLAAVATSGDYGDLENKPTIPDAQVQSDWNQSNNSQPDFIKNKPTIPVVNDATLTIQKNGTAVDTFTANASHDKTINIIVPTTASDVSALPASTKYAASIDLSINSITYVMTAQLKDQDGNNIGSADTIDLPLESVVVNGSYNAATKKVVLTLQSGSTIEFSVADLVEGLQSEITSSNKLSADLISEGTFNKLFTAAEKNKLDGIAAGAEVNVQSDWAQTDAASDDYIKNKPNIDDVTEVTAASLNELNKRLKAVEELLKGGDAIDVQKLKVSREIELPEGTIPASPEQSDWNETDTSSLAYIKNKPTIPAEQVNADWNANSGKAQILNKPTIPDAQIQSDWEQTDNTQKDYIKNKPSIPATQIQSDWNQSDNTKKDFIKNKPTIPTVNNAALTIKRNGTTVDSFTANASADKEINIIVPTSASDVGALPSTTKYATSLSLTCNSSTYVVTAQLKDQDGNSLGSSASIDLPLESVVVSGSYDASTKKVVLTLQNGSTVEFSVDDLVAGLQSEITAQNPLSADLLTDGTTNKVYTAAEQTKLAGIASGAEVNVQSDWAESDPSSDAYINHKPTNVSDFNNDAGYLTSFTETDPTVPSWAKAQNKPTYSYSEITNTPSIPEKTSDLDNDSGFITEEDIPTVGDGVLTVKRNNNVVDTFSANASQDKIINIVVPTTASDVSALPSSTKYAANLSLSVNSSTYVITAQLKDQDGNNIGNAGTIDLPLESVVVSGSYDNVNKYIVLTLESGSVINIPVGDLVSGLQSEITSEHPLSCDLLTDGITNKVFTLTMKNKLDGIETGAQVNVQSDWNQTDTDADDYIKNKPTIHISTVECATSSGTAIKVGQCTNFTLKDPCYVFVKMHHANSAATSIGLNINYSGSKRIYINGEESSSTNNTLPAGTYIVYFDGTNYHFRTDGKLPITGGAFGGSYNDLKDKPSLATVATSGDYNDLSNTPDIPYTTVECPTGASTANKKGVCTNFSLKNPCYIIVKMHNSNTASVFALTLNINYTGQKVIYINGAISGSNNYTLPAGTYIVYYDGTNYHFRTDGKLPIAGGAFGGSYNDLTDKPAIEDASEVAAAALVDVWQKATAACDQLENGFTTRRVKATREIVAPNINKFDYKSMGLVAGNFTVLFDDNRVGYKYMTISSSGGATININAPLNSENHLFIKNTGSADIIIAIGNVNNMDYSSIFIYPSSLLRAGIFNIGSGKAAEVVIQAFDSFATVKVFYEFSPIEN